MKVTYEIEKVKSRIPLEMNDFAKIRQCEIEM
jgi:hypothetical protein